MNEAEPRTQIDHPDLTPGEMRVIAWMAKAKKRPMKTYYAEHFALLYDAAERQWVFRGVAKKYGFFYTTLINLQKKKYLSNIERIRGTHFYATEPSVFEQAISGRVIG